MADTGVLLAFINALKGSGGGGSGITDVQVNGASVVTDGVAEIPKGSASTYGVVGVPIAGGLFAENGELYVNSATEAHIKAGTQAFWPLAPNREHLATFYGLAKAAGADMKDITSTTVGIYPAAQKSAISTMLHAPETVTGTTPTITALAGVQYVCGEVSTLDIVPPASGCFDVIFESGSTPTALTISNPTGTTVEWLNGFDPTNLSANAVYEINLLRMGTRYLGVAGQWT